MKDPLPGRTTVQDTRTGMIPARPPPGLCPPTCLREQTTCLQAMGLKKKESVMFHPLQASCPLINLI